MVSYATPPLKIPIVAFNTPVLVNSPDAVVSFVKFITFPHICVPSFEFEPRVRIPLVAFLAMSISPVLDELFAICNVPVVWVSAIAKLLSNSKESK